VRDTSMNPPPANHTTPVIRPPSPNSLARCRPSTSS
jgi:hypothetical protein